MKAYVLYGVGDLRWEDVPVPEIGPGWALVKVLAAGVCSSDIPRIFEKGTYHFPTIPGHEFCGVVERVHDPKDEGWVGKRVGVYPLIPCKKCPSCERGEYETCGSYDYIGSRRDGAFAEYTAVPVWNLMELPDSVGDVEGAMLEPASVALHGVRKLGGLAGKSVCVVGTGAIGLLAGQWAKALGAESVAIKGRSAGKRELAERCGLAYITRAEGGFDCVIEAVGTPEAIWDSIGAVNPGGRLVLLGNPSGDILLPQDVYWRILRRQIAAAGSWNSSFGGEGSDWETAVSSMAAGILRGERLSPSVAAWKELPKALAQMRSPQRSGCKVVIRL